MRTSILLSAVALSLSLLACGSDSSDNNPAPLTTEDAATGQDAAPDTGLPTCPNEVDLKTVTLPCDCFGHEANSTTIVDPSCKSQVVCCPTVSNLRCEDHEYYDDAGNPLDAPGDGAGDATEVQVRKCTNEIDMSKQELPCNCYGTIVESKETAMPDCTLNVVCCPGEKGLKCE